MAAAAASDATRETMLSQREVEIAQARVTAARLTACAYGREAELKAGTIQSMRIYARTIQQSRRRWPSTGRPHYSALVHSSSGAGGNHGDAEDGEFACEHCGKVLSKQGALTMHMRFCQVRIAKEGGGGGGKGGEGGGESSSSNRSAAATAPAPSVPSSASAASAKPLTAPPRGRGAWVAPRHALRPNPCRPSPAPVQKCGRIFTTPAGFARHKDSKSCADAVLGSSSRLMAVEEMALAAARRRRRRTRRRRRR